MWIHLVWPLVVVGVLAWRWYWYRSFTGALLGVRIIEDVGEIELASQALSSCRLKVYSVQATPQDVPEVAIALVSKAALGASLIPFRLSHYQARELIGMLEHACRATGGEPERLSAR